MRVEAAEMRAQVVSLHEAALVTWKLRTKRQSGDADLSIQLHQPGQDKPRYTLRIVDRTTSGKGAAHKFVAFVVPQGR